MQPVGTNPVNAVPEFSPAFRERRRRVRHRVHTPAYAHIADDRGPLLDLNEIVDLSEEGMCVQSGAPLDVDRKLKLCLDLSESKDYIYIDGQVIWSSRSGRVGVRFHELVEPSQLQLK